MEKICWQITVAAFMQPLQYDLRSPAAKDNSITNAATARRNLDATIYREGTILDLQITMEFHQQLIHQHHLQSHLPMRERSYSCKSPWNSVNHTCTKNRWNPILQCGTDPTMIREYPRMIRPHTRPSRTRRTAEVDHRRSGTDFVWKNIGFRASAISQKRISCETSFKTPSATHPPAPLAIPFTVRERS